MKVPFHYRAIPARQFEDALDDLAELLSLDMPLAECAERMHVSGGTVAVLLRELCGRYGEVASA